MVANISEGNPLLQRTNNMHVDKEFLVYVPHDSTCVGVHRVFCPHYKLLPADVDCHL